jgi:hypothetical protein
MQWPLVTLKTHVFRQLQWRQFLVTSGVLRNFFVYFEFNRPFCPFRCLILNSNIKHDYITLPPVTQPPIPTFCAERSRAIRFEF